MLAEILLRIGAAGLGPDRPYQPSPSLAGPQRCLRALVYHARGVPAAPWGDRFASVLSDGNWHEELLKDWVRHSAYQLHSEQMAVTFTAGERVASAGWPCAVCKEIVWEAQVHGHIDGILTDALMQDTLLEVKSMDHFKFNRLWTREEIPADNLAQVALYLRGVQVVNPDLRRFVLVIKNRNTSQLIDHTGYYHAETDTLVVQESVRSDGERSSPDLHLGGITAAAVARLAEVEKLAAAETLPPRPFEFGCQFPCGYCRWQKTCWDGYEAEVEARSDHADLGEDAEDEAAYYERLGADISTLTKKRLEVKRALLARLESSAAQAGAAGQYEVGVSLSKRKAYTVEASTRQELSVRRRKEES